MARRGKNTGSGTGLDLKARGGGWTPLSGDDVARIADAAIRILTDLGISDTPDVMNRAIVGAGGTMRDGRLLFPAELIRATISDGPREVLLAGQSPSPVPKIVTHAPDPTEFAPLDSRFVASIVARTGAHVLTDDFVPIDRLVGLEPLTE